MISTPDVIAKLTALREINNGMISSPIVPAIIPTSVADLAATIHSLGPVPELHVDVVDGQFVPFRSWPYITPDSPLAALSILAPYTLEVDLMVMDPVTAAADWLRVGADRLVFHVESISVAAFKRFTEEVAVTVGISALNDTSFSELEAYLPYADFVQVMGIARIGAQGQSFDERVIDRITMLRSRYSHLALSLDGSVNATTLERVLALQLDRYIMGSAIVKAENPAVAYQEFSRVARGAESRT
jgi:ribulose-phosphate 3-epimerase